MKKVLLSSFIVLLTFSILAQAPQGFKYQSVVRTSDGTAVIANQTVEFRISILQGSSTGTAVYVETQSVLTNQFGIATFNIGEGSSGDDFTAIDWSTGLYWVKVEIDPPPTDIFEEAGISQLLSVPYALHSETAESFTETDPKIGTNTLNYLPKWDGSALITSSISDNGNVGIGITNPTAKLDVRGTIYAIGSSNNGTFTFVETTDSHTGVHENMLFLQNNSNIAESQANILFGAGSPAHGRAIISSTHDVSGGTYNGNLDLKVRNGSTSYITALSLRSSGNVGINETNPDAKLHVNGDAHITGNLVVDGSTSGEIILNNSISDLSGTGMMTYGTVDANSTGVGAALFIAADGNYEEANAGALATMPGVALALETGTGNKKILLQGNIRNNTWSWTPGGLIYISTTTGALTQTIPSASGQQVQIVGYASSANTIYFNPNLMLIEIK